LKLEKPTSARTFCAADFDRHFKNAILEWEQVAFTEDERERLSKMMLEKYLDAKARTFFAYHFSPLVQHAVRELFADNAHPHILELGCGSGSLSLLFALLGAKVTSVDMDDVLVGACRKRQAFYEQQFGKLDLEFHFANTFEFDYQKLGGVDAIYSLFAFNMMQPTTGLLPRIIPALRPGGKFMISDGNRLNLYNRFMRKRNVLTKSQMAAALKQNGCNVVTSHYQCCIPPALMRNRALFSVAGTGESVARALGLLRWFGLSYTIVARKTGTGESFKAAVAG